MIGRDKERKDLENWIESGRSEFIAIYGRRRVGKTFLVKKTLNGRFSFHFSGSYGSARKDQLLNFGLALRSQFNDLSIRIPENWISAFHELKCQIERGTEDKKVIFLDELPWLDTPKSGFLTALENFWNDWAYWREDIKLIVCGSATSWIINKIIRNKGGLHNRLTHSIYLKPFFLGQCEEYFKAYGYRLSRKQIAECYMIMGGIPYYLSLMQRGESVAQNIDRMFFSDDAPLKNEFENLYRSLYKNFEKYISVIKALATKGIGLTRKEIVEGSKLTDNGELSKILEELELCGFIRSYMPYQGNKRKQTSLSRNSKDTLYQLVDFYSLFYLEFQREIQKNNGKYWLSMYNSPKLNTWRGLTFELLCTYHIQQVKAALGIADVYTDFSAWRGAYGGRKAQIDLLIDRSDETINLCEMKYCNGDFIIDKQYSDKLEEKAEIFQEATNNTKNLLMTLITTKGLVSNQYSDIIQRLVTLDQLF